MAALAYKETNSAESRRNVVERTVDALATFLMLGLGGGNLNTMVLGGMALVFSRVIDNSVVVLENIFRQLELGEDLMQAAEKGGREVTLPVPMVDEPAVTNRQKADRAYQEASIAFYRDRQKAIPLFKSIAASTSPASRNHAVQASRAEISAASAFSSPTSPPAASTSTGTASQRRAASRGDHAGRVVLLDDDRRVREANDHFLGVAADEDHLAVQLFLGEGRWYVRGDEGEQLLVVFSGRHRPAQCGVVMAW